MLTYFLWALINLVPSLTENEVGINALCAFSTVSIPTLSTFLSGTLHLTSIAFLGLGLPPLGVVPL